MTGTSGTDKVLGSLYQCVYDIQLSHQNDIAITKYKFFFITMTEMLLSWSSEG